MKEIVLQAIDLSSGYDGQAVVREISFAVRAGEVLTLIGPNGAGKSTILKSISNRIQSISGEIRIAGNILPAIDPMKIAKRMSILTTDRVRAEKLTVRDVVSLGRYPYTGTLGILSEHDRAVTEETMEKLGVAALAERDIDTLSDGQRQRVMLARAVCQEPEVLVLDEPLSFLDVRGEIEMLTLLRALAKERGIALVLSLHELTAARRVSDTILCVKDGRIDRAGPPEEIFADGCIDELYGLPRGAYDAFFGASAPSEAERAGAFFQNRACKAFPCHRGVPEAEFNCLFCYCPLYALGEKCGGNFHYTETGIKSCVDCAFPHARANYDRVLARYPELAALAKREDDGV